MFLTVKQDLTLALGNNEVPRNTFRRRWISRPAMTASSACSCAPTDVVAYRELMEVMNLLREAGYLKIALVGLEDTGGRRWAAAGSGSAPVAATRP